MPESSFSKSNNIRFIDDKNIDEMELSEDPDPDHEVKINNIDNICNLDNISEYVSENQDDQNKPQIKENEDCELTERNFEQSQENSNIKYKSNSN